MTIEMKHIAITVMVSINSIMNHKESRFYSNLPLNNMVDIKNMSKNFETQSGRHFVKGQSLLSINFSKDSNVNNNINNNNNMDNGNKNGNVDRSSAVITNENDDNDVWTCSACEFTLIEDAVGLGISNNS